MTRADIVLLLIAVLALPFIYLYYWQPTTAGTTVRIMRGETLVRELALDNDQEISIKGPLGTSRLQIKNGKIRFISSPCTGKVCIHTGWLSHSGDFTACLPNRISIEIMGQGEYDSMNF
ncbi:hypothetical protein MNBD_GAMMA24-1981 [hydrothermal vent metagenome]|uniref:Uncharacterized protein n=1 Tax=hydrothermal vent metagenome TaxID=652676 RepID=A0A3B1B1H2_9ZZZZ